MIYTSSYIDTVTECVVFELENLKLWFIFSVCRYICRFWCNVIHSYLITGVIYRPYLPLQTFNVPVWDCFNYAAYTGYLIHENLFFTCVPIQVQGLWGNYILKGYIGLQPPVMLSLTYLRHTCSQHYNKTWYIYKQSVVW